MKFVIDENVSLSNPLRFPTGPTEEIVYIRHGKLKSAEEVRLIKQLLHDYDLSYIKGQLLTLSKKEIRLRPPLK